jgi:hypothetical protein
MAGKIFLISRIFGNGIRQLIYGQRKRTSKGMRGQVLLVFLLVLKDILEQDMSQMALVHGMQRIFGNGIRKQIPGIRKQILEEQSDQELSVFQSGTKDT